MKVIFFGSGAFGLPALGAIQTSSHALLGVVTNPDKAQGRSQQLQPTPVKSWALQNKIPVLEFSAELRNVEADVWVVISFGTLLSKTMLGIPKICALNVHASLLPRYRGASPIQSALLNGERETGVSVIRLTEKLDAGDVLVQEKIPVSASDYFMDLEKKLSDLSAGALIAGLRSIENKEARFKAQEESRVVVCRRISKEEGCLDWNDSAENIRNRIRAFQKWPGTYSFYGGKRILLHQADLGGILRPLNSRPGMILPSSSGAEIQVATQDRTLLIRRLQLEGRRVLSAEEFLKGFRLEAGKFFE